MLLPLEAVVAPVVVDAAKVAVVEAIMLAAAVVATVVVDAAKVAVVEATMLAAAAAVATIEVVEVVELDWWTEGDSNKDAS